uniref:Peptidase M43 pregnancy-associated plasma-A domain-containing protein n=1 Tax=Bionectria ochroleuca TaxID=29856 RepID=A0A8H7K5Z9_BIOOC
MLFRVFILLASALLAQAHDGPGCGTAPPSPEFLAVGRQLAERENIARHDNRISRVRRTIEVDVYLHTVATSKDKLVSMSVLHRQFAVLLKSYLPYGITFHLKGTTETINDKWSLDKDEMGMKRALRAGGYRTLNIYYVEDLHGDLGYCYYPTDAPQGSEDFYRDGCSVLSSTVPGARWPTSAWARRGCVGDNDLVDDTPAQASASAGCPKGRDSCPLKPGLDPIHNYMDYSSDECYSEFTSGQIDRIHSFWDKYRK